MNPNHDEIRRHRPRGRYGPVRRNPVVVADLSPWLIMFGYERPGLAGSVWVSEAKFETVTMSDLETMDVNERDETSFGIIGFGMDTIVQVYNVTEARMAGLDPSKVLGVPFFEAVAQCMNNFMVAQRFKDEADIDDIVPYVLTLRMRPTKVRLRLLAEQGQPRRYILIER